MSQHQEIISKPPALYKNMVGQDKPKTTQLSANLEPRKTEQEEAKIQLPPELADLFQDDRNPGQESTSDETKGQNNVDEYSFIPPGMSGNYYHQGDDDQGNDDSEDGEDRIPDSLHGQSKKIGKVLKNNNKKPQQQNIKKKLPMRSNMPNQIQGDSPDLTPQMLNKRAQCYFKTKMCPHLTQNGQCTKGERCTYAHSTSELRDQPDLRRTKVCHIFKSTGKCPNGNSCNFAHGETELRSTPEFYKTAPCQNFAKGKCAHGARCRFAHGESELRPSYNTRYINKLSANRYVPSNNGGTQQQKTQQPQEQGNFQGFQQQGMMMQPYTYMTPIPMNPYVQTFQQVVYPSDVYSNQMYVPTGYTTTPINPNGQIPFNGQMNQMQYQPMYGYGYPNGSFPQGNGQNGTQ